MYNNIKRQSRYITICLNYDLTTGNKIELADVFVPDTDIDLLAQNSIYKTQLYKTFSDKEMYFNMEYWENDKLKQPVNEINEKEFINEFLEYQNADKIFFVTYEGVGIDYGEKMDKEQFIEFKDCLEKVDIYSKYVTDESIFERDDIGIKNLYVCSNIYKDGNEIYYMIEEPLENLKIDVRIDAWMQEKYKSDDKFKSIVGDFKKKTQAKRNELLKLANENKNKYYFYEANALIEDYFENIFVIDHYEGSEIVGFTVQTNENSYEVNMDDFNDFFENKLIDAYVTKNYYGFENYPKIILTEEEAVKCNAKSESTEENYKVTTDTNE